MLASQEGLCCVELEHNHNDICFCVFTKTVNITRFVIFVYGIKESFQLWKMWKEGTVTYFNTLSRPRVWSGETLQISIRMADMRLRFETSYAGMQSNVKQLYFPGYIRAK